MSRLQAEAVGNDLLVVCADCPGKGVWIIAELSGAKANGLYMDELNELNKCIYHLKTTHNDEISLKDYANLLIDLKNFVKEYA